MHYFIQTIKLKIKIKKGESLLVCLLFCNATQRHRSLKQTAAAVAAAPFQFGLCNNALASLLPSLFTIIICHATQVFSEAVHAPFH